jgi:hypothetical protein
MHESDTYLAILDEGQVKFAKKAILIVGEERFGPAKESVKLQLSSISDLERLKRMHRRTIKAADWEEILATP